MDNISWPYTVAIGPDHPRRAEGTERFYWLYQNIGTFTVDWNLMLSYSEDQPVIYLFKTESDCVRFTLTWL
jgi:hypothetical protein